MRPVSAYTLLADAFPRAYLKSLRADILRSPYFTVNTLNRDFVQTRGFSVVFRRDTIDRVVRALPYFETYLQRVLRDDCNGFYLNPLLLNAGSRVDPHVDRSLRAYDSHVGTPAFVSVLYVEVAQAMRGGELVLRRGPKHLGRITPTENTLVTFEGDLSHSIERVQSTGARLSLVCEQYRLTAEELERIPAYAVESRARYA